MKIIKISPDVNVQHFQYVMKTSSSTHHLTHTHWMRAGSYQGFHNAYYKSYSLC